jgi:hypothetical protein
MLNRRKKMQLCLTNRFILAWYLLWKFVLSRFGVIRALLQLNQNDSQTSQKVSHRRQRSRRE